jgi:hypothetical protein
MSNKTTERRLQRQARERSRGAERLALELTAWTVIGEFGGSYTIYTLSDRAPSAYPNAKRVTKTS